LFEPHADIIVKGGRDVQYGHKLNLATCKSGLILDVVIEAGNPADAERFLPMLDRQIVRRGAPPRQTAADGGYASRDNLKQAKERGVQDVAFHKKCGIAVADMVKSPWVYRRLATSAPGSRPASPASNAPTAEHAARGAGSTTSRPTSGLRW
jgi:transposase, IS5 family